MYTNANGRLIRVKEEISKSYTLASCRDTRDCQGREGITWGELSRREQTASPEYFGLNNADDQSENREEDEEEEDTCLDEDIEVGEEISPLTTCVHCNKVCISQDALELHVRAMHKGRAVTTMTTTACYQCAVCQKKFANRISRNIHLRVHTGQRPYECNVCKKRFGSTSQFRRHVKTHAGERPFKCSICGRGFKQSNELKIHRRTHKIKERRKKATPYEDHLAQETSYTIVPPEHSTTNGEVTPAICEENPAGRNSRELKIKIKVERVTSNDTSDVVSPLSCDSGVKLESDRSISPDILPREPSSVSLVHDAPEHGSPSRRAHDTTSRVSAVNINIDTSDYDRNPNDDHNTNYNTNNNHINNNHNSDGVQNLTRANVMYTTFEDSFRKNRLMENLPSFTKPYHKQDIHNPANTTGMDKGIEHGCFERELQQSTTDCPLKYKRTASENNSSATACDATESGLTIPFRKTTPGRQSEGESGATSPTSENYYPQTKDPYPMSFGGELRNLAESDDRMETVTTPRIENNGAAGLATKKGVSRKSESDDVAKGSPSIEMEDTSLNERKIIRLANTSREVAQNNKVMQCSACMLEFPTVEMFTAHKCAVGSSVLPEGDGEAVGLKGFKCSVCAKIFARPTLLRQHMVLHQGSKRFKFKCNYCGRAFRHRSHLRDHERIHTGERPFKCSFCPKAFKQSSDLRKHENLHTGATRYRCEFCKLDFKRCDALKKHAMLHREGEVIVLRCDKCRSMFASADGPQSHVCQNISRYRCQQCTQRFSTGASLREHCHKAHVNELTHDSNLKCEFCDVQVRSLNALEQHLDAIHQLNKTHQCRVCEQQFSLLSQFEEHMKGHRETGGVEHVKTEAPSMANFAMAPPQQTQSTEQVEENCEMNSAPSLEDAMEVGGDAPTSIPRLSPSDTTAPQKYDFIPSRYQSLVVSPTFPPVSSHVHGAIPRLIKAAGRSDQLLEVADRNSCAPDEPFRHNLTSRHEFRILNGETGENTADRRITSSLAQSEDTADQRSTISQAQYHDTADQVMARSQAHQGGATADQHTVVSLAQHNDTTADRSAVTPLAQYEAKHKYTCLHCRREYYSQAELIEHVCDIQAVTVFQCLACDSEFAYYEKLQEHMKRHWRSLVYLSCSLCGERLRNEDMLKEHNLKHIATKKRLEDNHPRRHSAPPSHVADRTRICKPEKPSVFTGSCAESMASYGMPVITSVNGEVSSAGSKSVSPSSHNKKFIALTEKSYAGHQERRKSKSTSMLEESYYTGQSARNDVSRVPPYLPYMEFRKSAPAQTYFSMFGQAQATMVPRYSVHPRVMP